MNVIRIDSRAYRIPTEQPEADGTFRWDATTLVLVEVEADNGERGLGYSYTAAAAATLIREKLAAAVLGCDVEAVGTAWQRMVQAVRNVGRPGLAATAISAVDVALWDLKARVAGLPLFRLLGTYRERVPVYGSGGFTSYTEAELAEQFSTWVQAGIPRVKMKVGKDWGTREAEDLARVRVAREAVGAEAELFVDANGAYTPKQAIRMAQRFADHGVTYFEEPVVYDQLQQLAFVRRHAPMDIASGEYGYDLYSFRDVLLAEAVDVSQADATRCLGVTGCLRAAALADTFGIPFSTHTAPALHVHIGCAVPQISHLEYFHDHVRIEHMLFDGAPRPEGGDLKPDPDRPGLGLAFRRDEAAEFLVADEQSEEMEL